MNKLILGTLCLSLAASALAQDCPIPKSAKPADPIPLCLVAQKIKQALDDYNSDPDTDKKALPLSKAEFDFKVVRSTSGGVKVSFFIFSIGATHQVDSTDEVTFSYEVPKETVTSFISKETSPDFSKQLVATIREAAKQVKATQTFSGTKFKTVTINLAYAAKWDFTAGVTVPIQLVTVGGSFDRNKTSTQSVKLTFGQ